MKAEFRDAQISLENKGNHRSFVVIFLHDLTNLGTVERLFAVKAEICIGRRDELSLGYCDCRTIGNNVGNHMVRESATIVGRASVYGLLEDQPLI